MYRYFTPKELRDQAREESQAPRNSYELAFRNQFFTSRYVVEFLTDNTLGRIWYEMRKGNTVLKDHCRYMVRRPDEVFLADLSHEARDEGRLSNDLALLLGGANDFPPFSLPKVTVHPAKKTKPGVIEMGWVDYDDAGSRLLRFAHAVRPFDWCGDPRMPDWRRWLEEWTTGNPDDPVAGKTQDLWDLLLALHRADRFSEGTTAASLNALTRVANEIRRRLLVTKQGDASQEDLLRAPVLIPHRPKKDPREIKVLDPACGSGHFLLYCFGLLPLAGEVGSLLKIEEDLRETAAAAEAELEEKLPLFRMTHHEPQQPATETLVRFVPGEQDLLRGKAEGLVLAALEDYARFASGGQGLVRRLFADDAARGFALIDLCRRRFAVVLMNPPFGDGSKPSKSSIEKAYPRTKNDLYAAFVECGLRRPLPHGFLGAITSRTGFFLTSFKKWREESSSTKPSRPSSPILAMGCSTRRWSRRRRTVW